jgi:hypothetical protein
MMKKYAKILATIAFLTGSGLAANAEMRDDLIVKLPFQFVVDGKILPAGTYEVSHLTTDNSGPLMLTNKDNGTSMFVLPFVRERVSADKPTVSFQQVGEQCVLSTIQTTFDIYQIHLSPSAIMDDAARVRNSGMSSGGSGN